MRVYSEVDMREAEREETRACLGFYRRRLTAAVFVSCTVLIVTE